MRFSVLLPVAAFVVLAGLAIAVRTPAPGTIAEYLGSGGAVFDLGTVPTFPPLTGLRVGAGWAYEAVAAIVGGLGNLVMIGPQTAPLAQPSPWGDYSQPSYVVTTYIPIIAYVLNRLLILSPILIFAFAFHRSAAVRTVLVVLALMAVGGWPPVYVNAFFAAMSHLADWPMAYYSFHIFLLGCDVASIGYVFLLASYMARRPDAPPWHFAVLAALGQPFYENLGFLTGIAAAAAVFLMPSGDGGTVRLALRRLLAAGAGSILVAAALIGYAMSTGATGGGGATSADGASYLDRAAGIYAQVWENAASYNFKWLNVIIANIISVLALPAIAGAIAGLILVWIGVLEDSPVLRRHLRAMIAVGIGFAASLSAAFFMAGLVEFGRQGISMATLIVPLSMAAVVVLVAGRRRT